MKNIKVLGLKTSLLVVLGLLFGSVLAQDMTVVADGLSNPRQISYAADGTLYIAEVGIGGTSPYVVDEETTLMGGLTSQISAVAADGTKSIVVPWMPSMQTRRGDTGFRGAQAVLHDGDTLWIAIGEAGTATKNLAPLMFSVMGLDPANLRVKHSADTLAADIAQNPDGSEDPGSDPVDLAMNSGTLYIADANCNCVWAMQEGLGLVVEASWSIDDNPVPTSIAFGPTGDLFVGFLSGFPFPEGGARIEQWSGGSLVNTFSGLNLVTDIHVDADGNLYAVELASGLGDRGFVPESGRVVMVSASGITPIAEGLNFPYGMAQAPDGSLVVTINSSFTADAGQGSVIVVQQ